MKEPLAALLATGGIATAWFAQVANGLDPALANLIGNGVTIAVLCWYVVYDIRIRTPNMLSAFAREQDEIRKAFKEEQAGSRETWTRTIETIRATFQAEQLALRTENRDDRALVREQHDREIDQWRKMVTDLLTGMRTAVHDVKNTAQLAITRADLAATVPKGTADSEGANQPSRPS